MTCAIDYGSICSGIEAASLAWECLDFKPRWFAEIEPFPSAVLAYRWPKVPNLGDMTKLAREVLLGIVAVKAGRHWQFDYDPTEVLDQVVCSGCIPDQKSHQFYPTPQAVAEFAVSVAEIDGHHGVLEPSAGIGGLADYLPKLQTTCVEISPLHCQVLEAKGFKVIEADFLKWAPGQPLADRIVMNPPFSEGRWQAHLQHAAGMLADDGRLVAILPASAKGKDLLPGWHLEWPRTFDNEFAGTSVSVVVLVATRT